MKKQSSISQTMSNPIANLIDTYDNVEPGLNKTIAILSQTRIIPMITMLDTTTSSLPGKTYN